jgi:6-phosphogluconolactonase (cycloisomerase 2 family)
VNEIEQGAVQSFQITPDGKLSNAITTVSTGGNGPAFVAPLSTGQVAAVNFGGGNGKIIPTTNPFSLATTSATITFPPPSGGVSNPHMVLENKGELLVPDLGGDTIWRLVQDGAPDAWKINGKIPQPQGSGPRHIALFNNILYTLHEKTSTLTSQKLPPAADQTGQTPTISSVSIVPSNPPEGSQFAAAEILLPPPTKSFPKTFVYASNRNIGSNTDANGDTIAIYEALSDGSLNFVAQVFTGLDQIRSMAFSKEVNGEQYLVAGAAKGDGGVVVLRRVDGGRGLTVVSRNRDVETRSSFVWL